MADSDLVPQLVRGVTGTIGVHHGHDLVILQGTTQGADDRYLWVGEVADARVLAAVLLERADRAEAAQRRAEEADQRGPCGHDGCNHQHGHAGRHSWQENPNE
jgi:hypothetical protein